MEKGLGYGYNSGIAEHRKTERERSQSWRIGRLRMVPVEAERQRKFQRRFRRNAALLYQYILGIDASTDEGKQKML